MSEIENLPGGYRLLELDSVESTNITAFEYAKLNDPGNLWIIADSQRGGKGSRGRSWISESGNLYASLLLRKTIAAPQVSTLTFVASLALFHVFRTIAPNSDIALKWPNDLLLNGRKISGILLENHMLPGREQAIIIGIGVNCQSSPQGTPYAATSLSQEGISAQPHEVFKLLAGEIDKWIGIWDGGDNFSQLRSHWLEHAQGLGHEILVKTPNIELRGIFEDLDENGLLILKTPEGERHKISTADIFFSNHNKKGA